MIYHKSKLILFGGIADKTLEDENFYEFNTETRNWKILEINGIHPAPRYYFSMNFISEDEVLIFGGKKKDKSNPDTIVYPSPGTLLYSKIPYKYSTVLIDRNQVF